MSSAKIKAGLFFAFAVVMTVSFFQNCSEPFSLSENLLRKNGNGTGYDGKPYQSYGTCAGVVQLKTIVYVREDGRATFTRENCQDLVEARSVDAKLFKFSFRTDDVLVFDGAIFDAVKSVAKETQFTRTICWSQQDDVESSVFLSADLLTSAKRLQSYTAEVTASSGQSSAPYTPVEESNDKGVLSFSLARSSGNTPNLPGQPAPPGGTFGLVIEPTGVGQLSGGTGRSTDGAPAAPKVVGCFIQPLPLLFAGPLPPVEVR